MTNEVYKTRWSRVNNLQGHQLLSAVAELTFFKNNNPTLANGLPLQRQLLPLLTLLHNCWRLDDLAICVPSTTDTVTRTNFWIFTIQFNFS
jgi:hypothetical protein